MRVRACLRSLSLTLFLALAALSTTTAIGQTLGTIIDVQTGLDACGTQPRNLLQPYACFEMTVSCPLINNRLVNLRITEPPPGMTVLGTLVMGMGGNGRGWYELGSPSAEALLNQLNAAGYRVVQRAWGLDPDNPSLSGWVSGSVSLHRSACRYATLLDWVYNNGNLHDPNLEGFCATGNSGGSTEIGYALSVYRMDSILDLALLTGGPPHGVVHRGCGVGAEDWEAQCNHLVDARGICPQQAGNHNCFYSPNAIANNLDAAFDLTGQTPCADRTAGVLVDNSVLHPAAVLDYPQTSVRFLIGQDDCGSAPPLGLLYIRDVRRTTTGPFGFEVIPGAPHALPSTLEGAAAIHDAVTGSAGCSLRH